MKVAEILLAGTLCALMATAVAQEDRTAGQSIDDATLQSKVKTHMLDKDFGESLGINLEVKKGVVQMSGFVDDDETKMNAEKTAAEVEGVERVSNQLVVKESKRSMGQSVDDGVIGTTVGADLLKADDVDSSNLVHDTYNGTVLLAGFTKSVDEKMRAEEIAKGVKNVKQVINGIDVMPD